MNESKYKQWREWVEESKENLLKLITPEQERKWEEEYQKVFDIQYMDYGAPTCKDENCPIKRRHWHFADEEKN